VQYPTTSEANQIIRLHIHDVATHLLLVMVIHTYRTRLSCVKEAVPVLHTRRFQPGGLKACRFSRPDRFTPATPTQLSLIQTPGKYSAPWHRGHSPGPVCYSTELSGICGGLSVDLPNFPLYRPLPRLSSAHWPSGLAIRRHTLAARRQ